MFIALLLEPHLNLPSKPQYKIPLSSTITIYALNCFLLLTKDSTTQFLTLSFSEGNSYFCSFSLFLKMNRTSSYSSSLFSFGGSSISSSSFGDPIRAPAPIVPLRAVHNNDNLLVNDIASMLIERDVDRLHDHYQIS